MDNLSSNVGVVIIFGADHHRVERALHAEFTSTPRKFIISEDYKDLPLPEGWLDSCDLIFASYVPDHASQQITPHQAYQWQTAIGHELLADHIVFSQIGSPTVVVNVNLETASVALRFTWSNGVEASDLHNLVQRLDLVVASKSVESSIRAMLTGITQNNDEADAHSVEFVAPATLEWRSLADDPLWQSEQKIEPTTPEIRIGVTASERLCREAAELRKQWQVDGNVTQAIRLFENAVEQYPDQWMAHYGLGDALLFRAEDGSAVSRRGQEALFRAAQLGPNQIEPALALAESLATTDIMLASKFYDYAVHIADAQPGPSLFPVGWQAGKCWAYAIQAEKAGLQASAIDAFRRALANREAPEYHGYSVDIPVANTALEQARRSPGITSVSTTPLTLPAWDAADRTIGKQQYIYRPDWISWLAMYQYILLRQ